MSRESTFLACKARKRRHSNVKITGETNWQSVGFFSTSLHFFSSKIEGVIFTHCKGELIAPPVELHPAKLCWLQLF